VELLVEAGFTPLEALRIASWNGAAFLGQQDKIGSAGLRRALDWPRASGWASVIG
jgi:adenine deaminase